MGRDHIQRGINGVSGGTQWRPAAARSVLEEVMSTLFALARQLANIFRHRREAKILTGLDAHMLADIGLNRADLRDAFAEPLWRDPTRLLEARAGERRTRKRRCEQGAARLMPARQMTEYPPTDRRARLHL